MPWREEVIHDLPPANEDEPADLRRDILDELSDHLECAMRRECARCEGEHEARSRVLKRFGDPAQVARKLWLDAMKEKLMNQRILIGTNVLLAVLVIAMFVITMVSMRQNQAFQAALIDRMAEIGAPTESAVADRTAMSWPTARVGVEGGNPPFRLELSGEIYNPGESITLTRDQDGEPSIFGPMRPGRYSLVITDDLGMTNRRRIVVPPGGVHDATVLAPEWQPQPQPVRMQIDLPDGLAERLGVIVVLDVRTEVPNAEQRWLGERIQVVVSGDGRAGLLDGNLWGADGFFGSQRAFQRDGGPTVYRFNPDDLPLQDEVVLDASLHHIAHYQNILYPQRDVSGDGMVYYSVTIQSEVTIDAGEVAGGVVRIVPNVTDNVLLAQLRSALEQLQDE